MDRRNTIRPTFGVLEAPHHLWTAWAGTFERKLLVGCRRIDWRRYRAYAFWRPAIFRTSEASRRAAATIFRVEYPFWVAAASSMKDFFVLFCHGTTFGSEGHSRVCVLEGLLGFGLRSDCCWSAATVTTRCGRLNINPTPLHHGLEVRIFIP